MDMVTLRRQHTSWAIQQNPTTITIHRTEKIDMGGYFEEVESEVGPFVVRIYQYGTWIPQDVSTLAGTKQVDKTWGMLADWQADIRQDPMCWMSLMYRGWQVSDTGSLSTGGKR